MNNSTGIDVPLIHDDSACRVCLSSDVANKCIFTSRTTPGNRSSADLWAKLEFYGGIEVKQGDGLPSKMCEKCVFNIRVAHDFRTRCQQTDARLRLLYRKVVNDVRGDLPKESGGFEAGDGPTRTRGEASTGPRTDVTLTGNTFDRAVKTRDDGSSIGNEKAPTTSVEKSLSSLEDESRRIDARLRENASTLVPAADEKSASNKEEHARDASERLIVFRRITSMENLKNCKELQRRYLKKTKASEKSRRDSEITRIKKRRTDGGRAHERELAISRWKCGESYKGEKSSEDDRLGCATERFSRNRCDERFDKPTEFSGHADGHESTETFVPVICGICNKNFCKVPAMVRHLNVHKRENPGAVYAILLDIREKRRKTEAIFQNVNNVTREVARRKEFSSVRIENSSRLDESRVEDFSKSQKDPNSVTAAWNIDSSVTNETEFSDSSRAYVVLDKSEFPSDAVSAIKLINVWIREELDSESGAKGFTCNVCKRSYVTESSLLKHKSKVHDDSPGRDTCPRHSTDFNETRESGRKLEGPKRHRCKDCEKAFESETKLAKHKKIHIRDKELEDKSFKRFLCHICSKTFRHNTGLMFHMRTHTGYKPHVCKYCGRGFTSNSNCINHERTHTGDRPFVCHFCSAAFAKSCTLKAHITTHTGEANYHCKTCGKSFRRLKYLKEHSFTHTGEKPYACKLCGTAYSHSGSLFVHEKKCRAQHNDCRVTMASYNDGRTVVHAPNLAIDPATLSIPNPEHVQLNVIENARFVDDARRPDRTNDDVRSSLPNSPSAVRNFVAMGQIF